MLDTEEFKNRLKIYSVINGYDDDFFKFWKWKLETENENVHILDYAHRNEAHLKLCEMAGKWQVYRLTRNKEWRKTLRDSLERMAYAYNQIRRYSLLEFNHVPQEPLKLIWDELGRVKEKNGDKSSDGNYYTVAITKPLMFLWGQTLAFDSNVREFIPLSGIPKTKFKDTKWDFETWRKAVESSSDFLKQNSAIIDLSKKISIEKYGTDSIVPYGRFLNMYYWIGGTPYEKIHEAKMKPDVTKYADFVSNVTRENEDFLNEYAKETYNEISELINDSIDYMQFFAKKGVENWAKSTMAFFTLHMLMPLSYAILVDSLSGNIPVCFMELRLMLESLAKCYLADLKYPDSTFFQEKLELLEKETKLKNSNTIKKRAHDFMEEFDKELGFNKSSIKLWGKLSEDWIHTKGVMDKVVYQVTEKSNVPPWGLVIPCNFVKADLEDIEELYKRISQFRNLLRITMKNYKQEFSFEEI